MSTPHESALDRERPSLIFSTLARWVLSHAKLTLAFTLLLSMIAALGVVQRLKVDNSLEVFAPADAPVMQGRERYRARFGSDELFMISARASEQGGVFSRAYLQQLAELEAAVQALELEVEVTGELQAQTAAPSQRPDTPFDDDPFDDGFADDEGWGEQEGGGVVEQTTSLISARRTHQRDGALLVERWFDPLPTDDERLERRAQEALRDHQVRQRLVNERADLSVLLVRVSQLSSQDMRRCYEALEALLQKHQAPNFRLRITGPPAVNEALNKLVIGDLSVLFVLSGLAMTLALIWLFRAPLLVVGPMVVVTVAVLWTVGLMAWLGMGLNLLSSVLPAFLLCVGLGDSIHVQAIYQRLKRGGLSGQEAIVRACGLTGPPVLFTSLTTTIGLLSFQFASVTAVKEMGLAGGVGVLFALAHSLITLPLFLAWHERRLAEREAPHARLTHAEAPQDPQAPQDPEDGLDRLLASLVGLSASAKGRAAVLASSLVLVLIACVGLSQLEVWHDDLESLPDDQPIKAAVREVDRELGGVASASLLLSAQSPLGVKDLALLKGLEGFTAHLLSYRDPQGRATVGHVISPLDVLKETRRALLNEPSEGLPETQQEASELMSLFELSSPDELRRLTTIDLQEAHLTMQVKWREATSYAHLIEHVERGAETHLKGLATVEPTGGIYLAYTIVSSLINDLLTSFTGAFLVITLLMVLMLRSVKLGALAMIPNLTPILLMLGGLGLVGIPLDLNNLLVASIALGIAVDDTIHLLHHFQAHYEHTGDREGALTAARLSAGRAMVSTSLLLGAGFLTQLFASTAALQRFGVIIALTLLVALLVDLILCPAILRLAYPASRVIKEGRC